MLPSESEGDWTEDLAHEDDDSAGEDSVSSIICFIVIMDTESSYLGR